MREDRGIGTLKHELPILPPHFVRRQNDNLFIVHYQLSIINCFCVFSVVHFLCFIPNNYPLSIFNYQLLFFYRQLAACRIDIHTGAMSNESRDTG